VSADVTGRAGRDLGQLATIERGPAHGRGACHRRVLWLVAQCRIFVYQIHHSNSLLLQRMNMCGGLVLIRIHWQFAEAESHLDADMIGFSVLCLMWLVGAEEG
jgi:hypothetical protein